MDHEFDDLEQLLIDAIVALREADAALKDRFPYSPTTDLQKKLMDKAKALTKARIMDASR